MCRKRKKDSTAAWQPGRFDCAYCRRSVRGETHLRHKDESKADLALCTDCYTAEVEVQGGPKWDADNVKVVEPSIDSGPLLVENWLADQEKLLLEGILQYGFGNWRAVSEHVGDKDEKACEEHYEKFYLRSKAFPLPDLSGPPQKVGDGDGATAAAMAAAAKAAAVDLKAKPEKRGASGLILDGQSVAAADVVGYMPLRGEYDTEYDNDAELAIAEIEINGKESEEELQSKLDMLFNYNNQLDERQRRRDFVMKHDVQDRMARHHAMDRRLTREERLFRTAMRPYAQHTTVDEHENLMKAMLKEQTLQRRVAHLRGCALTGIRSLPEANSLWRLALAEDEPVLKRDAPTSRAMAVAPGAGGVGGPAGAGGFQPGLPLGAGGLNPGLGAPEPHDPMGGLGGFGAAFGGPSAPQAAAQKKKLTAIKAAVSTKAALIGGSIPGSTPAQSLLATDEAQACLRLGIAPAQYVACRRMLLLEAVQRSNKVSLEHAQAVLKPKLDARRAEAFWRHCVSSGWIAGS